jgi:hypothetical protein
MMSLMIHCGAEQVDYDALCALETPMGTDTHVPIPHKDVVEMVRYSLGFYEHDIVEEHHAITPDGARYFGVLSLKSAYGDYTDMVGLRNSHDKKFPIGISFGSRVFVCDNLAFNGDHVIKRRHTQKAKRDLPGLVAEVVEPLRDNRRSQHRSFQRFHDTALPDDRADMTIMRLYREGVINVQRIAQVAQNWDEPPHDWGGKSAWRLFNAATLSLNGRVAEDPTVTAKLHNVIEGVCTRLN